MATIIDPTPKDKYTETEEGGIRIDQSFEDIGVATDAFVKFDSGGSEAYLWLFRPGAQSLTDRIVYGGTSGVLLNKNGTGVFQIQGDSAIADLVEDGDYFGSATGTAGGNLHSVIFRLNGEGDFRVYSYDSTTGSVADVSGDNLNVATEINPIAADEGVIT